MGSAPKVTPETEQARNVGLILAVLQNFYIECLFVRPKAADVLAEVARRLSHKATPASISAALDTYRKREMSTDAATMATIGEILRCEQEVQATKESKQMNKRNFANGYYDPDDENVERRQRAATMLINSVMSLLTPLSPHTPEQRAEWLVRDINLSFWPESSPTQPTVETFEYCAEVLAAFVKYWNERVQKEEKETLRMLLRKYPQVERDLARTGD
jgi:hypothetical protein